MARPHVEFIQAYEVEPSPLPSGALAGSALRMLSEDGEDGSYTALLSVPDGITVALEELGRPVEVLLLVGNPLMNGERLRPGAYCFFPQGSCAELRGGCEALFMVEPAGSDHPGETAVVHDTESMPWEDLRDHLGERPGRADGGFVKMLRKRRSDSDWSWLRSHNIGRVAGYAEIHPTVEECLLIRGDCLLGNRGTMVAGSYFYRPPMVPHGPFATANGALFFFRTRGGGLKTEYAEVPGWWETVAEYRSRTPFFELPRGPGLPASERTTAT